MNRKIFALSLLSIFVGLFSNSNKSYALSIEEVHSLCIRASDYDGCFKRLKSEYEAVDYFPNPKNQLYSQCVDNVDTLSGKTFSPSQAYLLCSSIGIDFNRQLDTLPRSDARYISKIFSCVNLLRSGYPSVSLMNKIQACKCDVQSLSDTHFAPSGSCIYKNFRPIENGIQYVDLRDFQNFDFGIIVDTVRYESNSDGKVRYISFQGKTVNAFEGTLGYSYTRYNKKWVCLPKPRRKYRVRFNHKLKPKTYECGFQRVESRHFEPGLPAGREVKIFNYTLDCQDQTFDRKGDKVNAKGYLMKGWLPIEEDLTAQTASLLFCKN